MILSPTLKPCLCPCLALHWHYVNVLSFGCGCESWERDGESDPTQKTNQLIVSFDSSLDVAKPIRKPISLCFPPQVFSLLIIAIGVYAKVQKATGTVYTLTHTRLTLHTQNDS